MNPASDYSETYEEPNIKVAGIKRVYFKHRHAFIFLDRVIVRRLNINANSWIKEELTDDGILLRIKHRKIGIT